MLCGTPPGMPPDRGVGLELRCDGRRSDAGSRPVTRRSDGELRAQLIGLLDRGWIQNSTAGHAAAMVFASKPDGSWHICYDCRGLHAITRPAVEPLPHIDALLDGTRGSRSFAKLDPAAITSCGRGPRIGGRRTFGRSWAGWRRTSGRLVCRGPPRC